MGDAERAIAEPEFVTEMRDDVSIHDNPNLDNAWVAETVAFIDAILAQLAAVRRERDEAVAELREMKEFSEARGTDPEID